MGIINITTDSFYDGGKFINEINMLNQVEKMLQEGANFIDIGGYSTRPGSKIISLKEELQRVIPSINLILKKFPQTLISIDSFRSKVVYEAINTGAVIINDISGGTLDRNMFKIVAKLKVPYILGHIQGNLQNMQNHPYYKNIVININQFFSKKINYLKSLGVNDIILDPGFGFGKNIQHNLQIIKYLPLFGFNNYPILIGLSRKSTLQKILNISAIESLNATSIMHSIVLTKKVSILRVHDVKECLECIKLVKSLN